jgi:hypothetical protein
MVKLSIYLEWTHWLNKIIVIFNLRNKIKNFFVTKEKSTKKLMIWWFTLISWFERSENKMVEDFSFEYEIF